MEQLCWMKYNLKLCCLKVSSRVFYSFWTFVFGNRQVLSSRSSTFVVSVSKGPTFRLHRGLLW